MRVFFLPEDGFFFGGGGFYKCATSLPLHHGVGGSKRVHHGTARSTIHTNVSKHFWEEKYFSQNPFEVRKYFWAPEPLKTLFFPKSVFRKPLFFPKVATNTPESVFTPRAKNTFGSRIFLPKITFHRQNKPKRDRNKVQDRTWRKTVFALFGAGKCPSLAPKITMSASGGLHTK